MFKRKHASAPHDLGLQQIDAYQRAIIDARMAHLRGAVGYSAAELNREHANVEALSARIGDALRADYLARARS